MAVVLECVLIIALIVFMARLAGQENRSGLLWGLVTFALCFLCSLIPLPFVRVLIAGAISFGAMFAAKLIRD